MQRSARFTKRVGHTLLEMMIAMAIFAIVFGVALQQVNDSTTAARFSTVQADLRRIGQDILSRIAQDLRSTQAQYLGVTSDATSGTGETLNLVRVTGYNASTGTVSGVPTDNPFVEVSPAGSTPSGTTVVYTQYQSKGTGTYTTTSGGSANFITNDGLYQRLVFSRTIGTGTPMAQVLTEELLPNNGSGGTNGFAVKVADAANPWTKTDPWASGVTGGIGSPRITSTSKFVWGTPVFADEPLIVAVELVFRRRMGAAPPNYKDPNNLDTTGAPQASKYIYCYVRMQTEVQVRPSGNY